jgi:DNA processing protein
LDEVHNNRIWDLNIMQIRRLAKEKWLKDWEQIKLKQLNYLGDLNLIGASGHESSRLVAMVGSRRMTNYGERVIEKIVPELVSRGIAIVSGLMYGVDIKVHSVCMECGGKAVAVAGWGLDYEIEEEAMEMMEKILQGKGLILSEYDDDFLPTLWGFPRRNRIIAGISQAVVIIEAAEKSGSLNTAGWAKKFNKPLLAVPGPVTSSVSAGTNQLVRDGEAEICLEAGDILCKFKIPRQRTGRQNSTPKDGQVKFQDPVLDLIADQGLGADELAKKLKISIEDLSVKLTDLELKGAIEEKEGKYYISI